MNKRLTILGVGLISLGVIVLSGFFLAQHAGLRFAAYTVYSLCWLVRFVTSKDQNWFEIRWINLVMRFRDGAVYDPLQREHFQVEITD